MEGDSNERAREGNASQLVNKMTVKQVLIDKLCLGTLAAEKRAWHERKPLELRLLDRAIDNLSSDYSTRNFHIPVQESETSVSVDQIGQWFIQSPAATKLHRQASKHGLEELEQSLRNMGVDVNAKSGKSGRTPLLLALQNKHFPIAKNLLEGRADPRAIESALRPF